MKVSYWVAAAKDDSPCYSIRQKTRKAVLANRFYDHERYEPPVRVEFEYDNALDLIQLFTQEGGPGEVY